MKSYFFAILLICATVFAHANTQVIQQRPLFLKVEKAIQQRQLRTVRNLISQLNNYPLYPYLIYEQLLIELANTSDKNINAFLSKYPNSLLADKLQQKWFNQLIKQEKYQTAIAYFKDSYGTPEQCQFAYAKLKLKSPPSELIKKLWLIGHEQPKECNALFEQAKLDKIINVNLLWERINLALANNDLSFARFLAKELPKSTAPQFTQLIKLYHAPELLVSLPLSTKLNLDPNFVTAHIVRLAKKNPHLAIATWNKWGTKAHLSLFQHQQIANTIGISHARKNPTEFNAFVKSLNPNFMTTTLRELQIRQSLSLQNWPQTQKNIDSFPQEMRDRPIWQYWYARSLEEQQKNTQASPIYEKLALTRNYYGFLSAHHLKKPLPIHSFALAYTQAEYNAIANSPTTLRVRELFALNRTEQANAEWWFSIRQMNDKQRYIAAKVAKNNHWDHLSLASAITTTHQEDLALRFPTMHQDHIIAAAKHHQIDPALLFALIRQESFFKPHATSYVGARGLMQLMPKTAVYIAKLIHFKNPTPEHLFNPAINIHLGSAYLKSLLTQYNENPILAIASYNAGPNRVKQWLPTKNEMAPDIWVENIPFLETRNYVKLVTTYMLIYQYMLEQPFTFDSFNSTIKPQVA